MGLITIFGINGVGKDTVANKLKEKRPNICITSMSRILMYILGISNTYETSEIVTEEQYKKLESIPQDVMKKIEENEYRELLTQISQEDKQTLLLSHLVSALRLGEQIVYLDNRLTPDWLVKQSDLLVQLAVPAPILSERRSKDTSRKRDTNIYEIEKHQKLCFKEWNRIKKENPNKSMYTIVNLDLEETVDTIERIMDIEEHKSKSVLKEGERNER